MVLRRCRKLLRDEDNALDAMQDIFAKLLAQNHPLPEFPSSFLYTMATHICIDKLRSPAYRKEADQKLLQIIASSEDIERNEYVNRLLDKIFHRHPPSTRVMAVMHYIDGMTFDQVAAQVNLSAAGVRRRMQTLKAKVGAMSGKETK